MEFDETSLNSTKGRDGDVYNTSPKKKFNWWWLLPIAALIAAVIFFYKECGNNGPQKFSTSDSVDVYNAGYAAGLTACSKITNDALRDSLSRLQGALINCLGAKEKAVIHKKIVKKPAGKPDKLTTNINQFAPPASNTPSPTPKPSNLYNTSLPALNNIVGLQDGDFYVSITPDGYLYYAFKQSAVANYPEYTFEFADKGGPKFILGNDGVYRYITGTLVTESMLKKVFRWCVYIGSPKGYPEYLPHEAIKWAIEEVKGTTAGRISATDLKEIGKRVKGVADGTIEPNGVYVKAQDGNEYGGWEFRNTILYKTK